MNKILLATCAFVCLFSRVTFGSDEFIDLRTFLKERTQQYPLIKGQKIYLNTAPRTGSTLVYNILRFLFENKNHADWSRNFSNIVIKDHSIVTFKVKRIYVYTLRNPIDAVMSGYRMRCSLEQKVVPFEVLNEIIQEQVNAFKYLEELTLKKMNVIQLRYEDFVDDFDVIFKALETHFQFSIDKRDKEYLKKALSQENVIKNIERFDSFSQYDNISLFHGRHINLGEFSADFNEMLKAEVVLRLSKYFDFFKKWDYSISL